MNLVDHVSGLTTVKDVYNYEPIPSSLEVEFHDKILGAQGHLWSEYMHTYDKVEYQAFPRVTALAEMLWTPTAKRDYDDFITRLPATIARLDAKNVNHGDVFDASIGELNDGTTVTTNMNTNGSHGLWQIRDFNESTQYWTNKDQKIGHDITFKLAKPITNGYIDLLAGRIEPSNGNLYDTFTGDIEGSSDGKNWETIFSIVGSDVKGEDKKGSKFDREISYIRLSVTADKQNWFAVRELGYGEFASTSESSAVDGDELVTITPRRDVFNGEAVTYSIVSGNHKAAYAIDAKTGVITVANAAALTVTGTPSDNPKAVQALVIKVVADNKLNLVEQQQAYIEVINDRDGGAVPGLEQWKGIADAEPTMVYSSIDSVLAGSARTINLASINTDSATYEMLVNAKNIDQSNAVLLGSRDGSANTFFKQEQSGSEKYGLTFAGKDVTFTAESGKSVASIYDKDTHIVLAVNGTVIKLYINGVLSATEDGKLIINSATAFLGDTSGDPAGNKGDEIIKGFAAYNSVLDDAKITELYNASGFAPVPPPVM